MLSFPTQNDKNFSLPTCRVYSKNRPATLLKKRLQHRCFPVNFAKFLRTPTFFHITPPVAASIFSVFSLIFRTPEVYQRVYIPLMSSAIT